MKNKHVLQIYFGVPGAGKTTVAAYLSRKYIKNKMPVWSNVPITGAFNIDAQNDIGNYMIENGKLIIDEAGLEYNNRDYKSFRPEARYFYKYHRHYKMSVDVFSQDFEDMDITLRRLAQRLYIVNKSMIPYFIKLKAIKKIIDIDEQTKQIINGYSFCSWLSFKNKYIFSPKYWKYFNSYSTKKLPPKDWEKW